MAPTLPRGVDVAITFTFRASNIDNVDAVMIAFLYLLLLVVFLLYIVMASVYQVSQVSPSLLSRPSCICLRMPLIAKEH